MKRMLLLLQVTLLCVLHSPSVYSFHINEGKRYTDIFLTKVIVCFKQELMVNLGFPKVL